jgi:hypothetical protein
MEARALLPAFVQPAKQLNNGVTRMQDAGSKPALRSFAKDEECSSVSASITGSAEPIKLTL